jgi:hypothetical protein
MSRKQLTKVRMDISGLESRVKELQQLAAAADSEKDKEEVGKELADLAQQLVELREQESALKAEAKPKPPKAETVETAEPITTSEAASDPEELVISGDVEEGDSDEGIDLAEVQVVEPNRDGKKDQVVRVSKEDLVDEASSKATRFAMSNLSTMVQTKVNEAVAAIPTSRRTRRVVVGSILAAALVLLVLIPAAGLFLGGDTSDSPGFSDDAPVVDPLDLVLDGGSNSLAVTQPDPVEEPVEDAEPVEEPVVEAPQDAATEEQEDPAKETKAWYYY